MIWSYYEIYHFYSIRCLLHTICLRLYYSKHAKISQYTPKEAKEDISAEYH